MARAVTVVRRDQHRERRDEQRDAQVVVRGGVLDRTADRDIAKAEIGALHLETRRLVGGRAQPLAVPSPWRPSTAPAPCRSNAALELCAESIAPSSTCAQLHADMHLDDAGTRIVRRAAPTPAARTRHALAGSPIQIQTKAARFTAGVGLVLHLLREPTLARLRGHFDDIAFDVDLPSVVQAAQAAFLVASQRERGPAVRTVFVDHAKAPLAVAKGDEVLAEQANAHRRAVRLRRLPRTCTREASADASARPSAHCLRLDTAGRCQRVAASSGPIMARSGLYFEPLPA